MTISADDIEGLGASDYIILGMCESCNDDFQFGEDEYDLPPPQGYYTDISFFNFDWVGTFDETGNQCDNPEFYIDRKNFHDPIDLLIWDITGFTNLNSESNNVELSWNMDQLSENYEIFLYIGNSSYDMRNVQNVVITQDQLELDYNPVTNEFIPNIRVVIGGCAQSGNITEYYYDNDSDGLGYGDPVEFCTGQEPDGWVINNEDVNDQLYCESNIVDQCGDCDGGNICVGCSDSEACNYSELITIDNGSCYYIEQYYDCDGNCLLDSDFDDICNELEILGCTDSNACNYDSEATEDDGSCEYPDQYYDCDGNCLLDSDFDSVCDELEILGCTNESSCLFNAFATEYDGSCCDENDPSCIESPGELENINISINLNSATIDWNQPCGVSTIWIYRLLTSEDDSGVVIPSPFIIEDLSWGAEYTYYIKTINTAGYSITEFTFTTEDEPLPGDVIITGYESGEAQILLDWNPTNNTSKYNIIRNDEIISAVSNDITSYTDYNIPFYPDIYYNYQIQGVNSQGNVGPIDSSISIQPHPVPSVENLTSFSSPGSIDFSWESPAPYASISEYLFRLSSDNFDTVEINENMYTLSDLNFGEQVCIDVLAIHEFGESNVQTVCDYPQMPYPPEVSNFNAIGNEGYVSITWTILNEPNHFINIYRDQQLIASNINTIESPPPYINDIYDGYELLANHSYSYTISASNSEFTEGEISDPITVTTWPLPIISDLSGEAGNGRIILNWSALENYGGFSYVYQIIDVDDNVIMETDDLYITIPNLSADEEYCFRVKANSLGGYGTSDNSNNVCVIPEDVFDGTEGDTDIDWGIQLSVDLLLPDGNILGDTQNMLGAAEDATDGCDPTYDVPELTDTPNYWAKLHFPHQDWDCALVSGSKYNNDIRSVYEDLNEVKEWDVHLETNTWEGGIATVSFYFYENAGGNTAYYTVDDINYIRVNDGDQIEYGLINPVQTGSFKIIVGNIIPEAPIALESNSGYREIELLWADGYMPGSLQYESTSYNIYRNNELIANTLSTSYIDRGLDFLTEYNYEVSGINIAGEGDKSQAFNGITLENRAPIPDSGIDLIIYDFDDDDFEQIEVAFPMNISNSGNSLLLLENQSYDLDNIYLNGDESINYDPLLDELNYTWESSDNVQYGDVYNTQSNGYGLKLFMLGVNDGDLDSDVKDSIYIKAVALPPPAKVYVDTTYSGLYSIDIQWQESNYTGEPYIKTDIYSEDSIFQDGDYFEDINGNGVYDSGSDPMPQFYGLSNLNNTEAYKNIADYYQVVINGTLIDNVNEPCYSNPEDIYLNEYCYSIVGLDPSTIYSIKINSCNFNDTCSSSENIDISTGDSPYASVIYPNGAEIIGMDDLLDIELDFGLGQRYIDSLYLSILIDNSSIWDTTIFTSSSQNIIDSNYSIPINNFIYTSGLNPDSKIAVQIIDEGGFGFSNNGSYEDESNYPFIITSNQIEQDFSSGWHIIGTPVVLSSDVTMQSHINNGIDLNNNNDWWIVDENHNSTYSAGFSDGIFNSGQGYYFNLLNSGNPENEDFSETLSLSGDVQTEYLIDNLHVGWNLISNPLVVSMNINNIDIIDQNQNLMNWSEANENGLISPYLLEFDHASNTLYPSYDIEPYKGYWVYLYENISMHFESKVELEDNIEGGLLSTDFIINLSSRAFGATSSSFGDMIQFGYSLDGSEGFIEGIDLPNLSYLFNEYTSMYILHEEEGWNSDYNKLSRDIREHYQPAYSWNIIGQTNAIQNDDNPDAEIELFWNISEIDSSYTVMLEYGENFNNQMDMKEQNYVKLNDQQFSNMRVVVELQNYFSGCSNQNACNYFCIERPWECPTGNLPSNFVDDNTCDLYSCVGCIDNSASNYNPNATIDSVCEGGDNEGFNCMNDEGICGESGVCVEQVCEYNESYLFPLADQDIYVESNFFNEIPIHLNNYNGVPIYGVEIELIFDNTMINIPLLDFSDSIIDDYSKLYYIDNDTLRFVAYSGTPTLSSGLLFNMQIEAIGEIGTSTFISFNKSILNDYEISSNELILKLSQGLFEVSGHIGYYSNDNYPVIADLNLLGYSEYNNPYEFNIIDTLSTTSIETGEYNFDFGLKGSYIMQTSRHEIPGSEDGLSAVDASRIARYLIDLIDFNEYQLLAADVDMNGQVSAVDAALVARYLIGLIDQFNNLDQHWRFSSNDNFYFNITDDMNYDINIYDLRPLGADLNNQNIKGVRIGDVDGSWISDVQARKSIENNLIELDINLNDLLTIPIAINNHCLVEGVDLKIKYNSEDMMFDNFQLRDNLYGYSVLINDSVDGELSLVVYANSNIEVVDQIFGDISFTLLNDNMLGSILKLDKILVNGNDVDSGFLVSDNHNEVYARVLSISAQMHPEEFSLGNAYPNPFNPITKIPFSIPFESNVDIAVYDINGRFVSNIISANLLSGNHMVEFDGKNLSTGIYIIKMNTKSLTSNHLFSQSIKVLLLK